MKKFMQKMWEKKNSKKGFTLVELIVVLVILAILMAIMIPAMTGWIDKARDKQILLDARNVEMATQAGLYEAYGTLGELDAVSSSALLGNVNNKAKSSTYDLKTYVETVCAEQIAKVDTSKVSYNSSGMIDEFIYVDGKTATYKGGVWTLSNK